MENETLTVIDNRTGKSYTLPFFKGCIRTMDLRQIKVSDDDFGVMGYDPAFMNTASCQSAITFIDGDRGILRYRGYPIEQLAEKCSYLEVCYLILYGELPNAEQLKQWEQDVTHHSMVPEDVKKLLDGFQKDAHPMGTLMSLVAALSTYYPDAKNIADPACRKLQILRLLGKTPTLAAYIYRHSLGLPYVAPDHSFSYTENFMNMLWKPVADPAWKPNKVLARALDLDDSSSAEPPFSDARYISPWARSSVAAAVSTGLIKGYPAGDYRPLGAVTRAECAAVIHRALSSF
ncbi:MAG: S-layer homology domain-containing protein [Bryobacteraceae bacterium]|nr:S-layer homology domain-containing protein [Bryobacteraceae bacterium]